MILLNAVIAGLVGLGGVALMTLSEFPFYAKWGLQGVAEWQVISVMISKLVGKKLGGNLGPTKISWIIASHFFHGVAAGFVFGLFLSFAFSLFPVAKFSILLDSLVYSLVLWVIFSVLLKGTYETSGGIRITIHGIFVSLLSHFIYGMFLGLVLPVVWIPPPPLM